MNEVLHDELPSNAIVADRQHAFDRIVEGLRHMKRLVVSITGSHNGLGVIEIACSASFAIIICPSISSCVETVG